LNAASAKGEPSLRKADQNKLPQASDRVSVLFSRFATSAARIAGKPVAFAIATASIITWAFTGPLFGFSDTWQLIINTSTTIVTFLMVFLIQNTQNRDGEAIQIKLDELIRSSRSAHNDLLDLEEMTAEDLHRIKKKYEALAERAREKLGNGNPEAGEAREEPDS
jgi:low affinity Fe/Cu permease